MKILSITIPANTVIKVEVEEVNQPCPAIFTIDFTNATPEGLSVAGSSVIPPTCKYIGYTLKIGDSEIEYHLNFRVDGIGEQFAPNGEYPTVDVVTGDSAQQIAQKTTAEINGYLDSQGYVQASLNGLIMTVSNTVNGDVTDPNDNGTYFPIKVIQRGVE